MKRLYKTSEFCPSPDPAATAFFWRSKEDTLLKVDFEKVDRDDPSKAWTDSETYNSNDPIYAGQSNGDMVRWSIGGGSLTNVTFTWLAEHPDGTAILGPSGVGEYEWIIADENPSNAPNRWINWKPGTWKIQCWYDLYT